MSYLSLFNLTDWRDALEIISISTIVYYFASWLKKDTEKNLSLPFYIYCASFIISHYLNLQILSSILLFGSPIILTVFILMHQKSLQKNFVVSTRLDIEKQSRYNWVEELVKSALYAVNQNQKVLFIIEQRDSLSTLLQADWIINALFSKEIFELVLKNKNIENIWLNQDGILVAPNAKWSFSEDLQNFEADALIATTNTDAIIIKVLPEARKFEIIANNKIYENLTAPQVASFLNSYVGKNINQDINKEEGEVYGKVIENKKYQQQDLR